MENEENEVTGSAEKASNSAQILDSLIPDTDNQGGEGAQPAQGVALVQASAVESLAGLLSLIGIGFEFKKYDRVAAVWNGQACHELAAKLVPVLAKYSWGVRFINFLNTGAGIEELALFPVALAMITSTYNAYMADSAAMKPKDETLEPGKTYDAETPLGSTFKVA